mmetsp:Transcript_16457/g.38567  ORF Transcript_16457/g.38567 Transcript_16457/m.38567 type:complete len:233 (+) Transcript_16457:42-740(+)|eukprot:CAMPEP_0171112118 /NCGR_PEP_ID=MMETSP0766_2-20121228/78047_1 /TAXON_ID=439317 /ORGANISM="Gambierdiscus australes, Strain CAWD 149" /LENGTH=232 /DNA_ID=CAMNT_0011574201 /DNA_START=1 /DNA_END=699 /DNA_ORIENTATION=+
MAEPDTVNYDTWSAEDVARFFTEKGYGEYASLWVEHRLTGSRVVMMKPDDLRAMGIAKIGDRLGIQKELRSLKSVARAVDRTKVIAEYKEGYHGNALSRVLYETCGCCCPREPDKYTLTSSTLKIRRYHMERIFGLGFGGCLGGQWEHDTIQLENIVDVDITITTLGNSCLEENKCWVYLSSQAGVEAESEKSRVVTDTLFMEKEDGEHFAELIRNQVMEHKLTLSGMHDSA